MLPLNFIQRIQRQKYIDAEKLQLALEEPSPVSIRVNPLKWNRRPDNSEPIHWCGNGYYLTDRPSYTFDPLFHAGCYYPQEASGMFLEEVFLQSAGSLKKIRVLDLCGAPGGKSTLLSDIIGPDSLLVANEVIRARAFTLAETITKWGSANTLVTQSDPAVFGRLEGFFDVILVDAPCSGEGMFRTGIAVSEWSLENTVLCAERQKRILTDIWPALKEDGILIYSTCTFNPAENEENIKWLTGHNEAECIRLDLKSFTGIKEIDFQGIHGYGFYPGKVRGEGFFISAIRKTGIQKQLLPKTSHRMELKPGKSDLKVAADWTEFMSHRIIKWGDETIALPCDTEIYNFLFRNLRIIKAGTRISVSKKNDNIPSHDLSLSVRLKKEAFPIVNISLDEAISYLRRDNFNVPNISMGWNIVTFSGINLGFIKNIGSRINNYFPVEWRIRLEASSLRNANPIKWIL